MKPGCAPRWMHLLARGSSLGISQGSSCLAPDRDQEVFGDFVTVTAITREYAIS